MAIGDFSKWLALLKSIGMSQKPGSKFQKLNSQMENDIRNNIPVGNPKYSPIRQFPRMSGDTAIEKKMLLQSMQEDMGKNLAKSTPGTYGLNQRWNKDDMDFMLPRTMEETGLTFDEQRAIELLQLMVNKQSKRLHDYRN